jgi:hypothetical protein
LIVTSSSSTTATLTWADNSNNERGFKVERKTGTSGTYAQIGTQSQNLNFFNDSGLTSGTQYCYRVRAANGSSDSNYSNEACVTTQGAATLPGAPQTLTATPGNSQSFLAWNAPSSNGGSAITSYRVFRGTTQLEPPNCHERHLRKSWDGTLLHGHWLDHRTVLRLRRQRGQQRRPRLPQYVDALFASAGVIPASTERTAAINEFGGVGTSADLVARGRALRSVAENSTLAQQETNKAFVLMQYFGYLRRNPNDAPEAGLNFDGYNFWLNKLNQFNGNYIAAEMVKAFITSVEYRQRFGS